MANNKDWGISPINSEWGSSPVPEMYERTYFLGYDTILYSPASVPSTQRLFDAATTKDPALRNVTFQGIQASAKYTVTGIRSTMACQFAQRNTAEPLVVAQQYFENYSFFNLKIGNKNYDPITLSNTLSYSYQMLGGTSTPIQKNDWEVYFLPDPFYLPKFNQIELSLTPPKNFTMAAAGTSNPVVDPTPTTTSFYIRVELWGVQERGLF